MKIKDFSCKYFVLLCLYLLLSFCFLSYFWNQSLSIVDENHYNRLATSILERKEFAYIAGKPTAIRPPLYPAFLALVYKIFGPENYKAVRLIQIFISLLSSCLVYSLAKSLFGNGKIALWAMGIFLFYPSLVIFNYLILTEALFTFFFLLALYLLVEGVRLLRRGFAPPRNDKRGLISCDDGAGAERLIVLEKK